MLKKKEIVTVVSPIFNDMSVLPVVLPRLVSTLKQLSIPWAIELIDDGSVDGSASWVRSYIKRHTNIHLTLHDQNKGIAITYRELYARSRGTIVVLFSLDGEWNPHDVSRMVRAMQQSNADIVIGVRSEKMYTMWRAFVSTVYNMCTRLFFGVETHDAGSIKAFRREVLNIPIISRGVFDEAERLIRASKSGKTISSISIGHQKTVKIRRGIRLVHVLEAVRDMYTVYRELGSGFTLKIVTSLF